MATLVEQVFLDPEPPAAWGGVMAARVVGHFSVFGLARLYGA
jgi:hypothetical protein